MFRSIHPYAVAAGIDDPVVCYQGAVVAEPGSGRFLRHVPIPTELALEAIAAVQEEGFALNCYVDDNLYVSQVTLESESYAGFQNIPLYAVGDLLEWLAKPPTKLVAIGAEEEMDALAVRMRARFDGRLYIPPRNTEQRKVPDALGPYKLDTGEGYLIHGTHPYNEESVGEAVSHGCVRMGNEDLARLYPLVPRGTPVIIF